MRSSRTTPNPRRLEPRRVPVLAGVALLAVGFGLAACGGDDDPPPAAAGATPAATLSPGTKATGEPVRLGFISAEGGSAVSLPEVREAAEAAVAYANDYLGGVAGRPVELVSCQSHEEPASARNCANRMVEEGVVGVVVGTTGFGDAIVPIVTGAGIPYFTVSGNGVAEVSTAGSFSWTGGFPSVLASMAKYARDEGLSRVAMFVTDAPAAVAGAQAIGNAVFGKAGVELDVVPIPRGAPDVTSEVTAAFGDQPDAVATVGDATHCTAVLKALQTVGQDVPTMVIQPCVARSVEDAVPGALNGTINFGTADIYSDDPDTTLYRTVMANLAPDTDAGGYAVTGYQSVLGLVRALDGLTGDVTAATITARVEGATDVALPAGHGLTFSCDGSAVPGLKALCSAGAVVSTVQDLKGTDVRLIEANDLFAG